MERYPGEMDRRASTGVLLGPLHRPNLCERIHAEVTADLACQLVLDFGMPWDRGTPILRWIDPPGMPATLPEQLAALTPKMPEQLLAFQTAIFSSW